MASARPTGHPGSKSLQKTRTTYILIEDGVYYLERERDSDRLTTAWNSAVTAAGQLGFVTTAAPDASAPTHEALLRAAAHATLIVFSAYDGEGVLLLEPTRGE